MSFSDEISVAELFDCSRKSNLAFNTIIKQPMDGYIIDGINNID